MAAFDSVIEIFCRHDIAPISFAATELIGRPDRAQFKLARDQFLGGRSWPKADMTARDSDVRFRGRAEWAKLQITSAFKADLVLILEAPDYRTTRRERFVIFGEAKRGAPILFRRTLQQRSDASISPVRFHRLRATETGVQ
jgi:hypothetical protein